MSEDMMEKRNAGRRDAPQPGVPATARKRRRRSKLRGFVVPPTLEAAEQLGLKDAVVDKAALKNISNNMPIAFMDDVPVGHLWHLGQVHGNMVYACYKTSAQQCHWKEVPSDDIPDWDPDGPQ